MQSRIYRIVHTAYVRFIRPFIGGYLGRQRLKLIWFGWGYLPLLALRRLPLRDRIILLGRFLRVDWNVPHAHLPSEIVEVCRVLAERPAKPDEVFVEAGCFQGGSACKFSLACRRVGLRMLIYDSFQGVEEMLDEAKDGAYDFSGEYAAPQQLVLDNLRRFGAADVCNLVPGWFCDTLAANPISAPVRAAYIDCDTAKGTQEVLQGVARSLSPDSRVFSQDFHIAPVIQYLEAVETWKELGLPRPRIDRHGYMLCSIRFDVGSET